MWFKNCLLLARKLCHLRNLIFRRKFSENYCVFDIATITLPYFKRIAFRYDILELVILLLLLLLLATMTYNQVQLLRINHLAE